MISIIIVNWNGKKWLQKCLASLYMQTYGDFEVILVDNNSIDDSLNFVRTNFSDVRIIESKHNLGFAGGNNLGIKNASGEFVLLLNSDTWLDESFLEKIHSFYMLNKYDVIAPVEADYSGKLLDYSVHRTIDLFGHPYFKNSNKKSFYLQGVCLFFKKSLYTETGGLDENFFMYFEETDWFWRLNLLGKKYATVQDIKVNHFGSGTSGVGIAYNTSLWRNQNALQMLIKNYYLHNLLWILPIYLMQNILELLFFSMLLKPRIAYSYIEGWLFNIKNLKRTIRERRWVQQRRKVNDITLMRKMYIGLAKINHLVEFYK
jgi:GT2 family glycosyltransferase